VLRVTSAATQLQLPPVGCSISETMRASVDLPQPDSPTTASVLPARTSKDTPPTACNFAGGLRNMPRRMV
jgi:hypothetical protein